MIYDSEIMKCFIYWLKPMTYWITLLIWVVVCALLDVIWVSLLKKYFHSSIWSLMKQDIDRVAAILTRVLLTWGILIFVISNPVVVDLWDAVSMGMLYGMIVYGIYECTNQALLIKRKRNLVLADVVRGMCLCSVVSGALRVVFQSLIG